MNWRFCFLCLYLRAHKFESLEEDYETPASVLLYTHGRDNEGFRQFCRPKGGSLENDTLGYSWGVWGLEDLGNLHSRHPKTAFLTLRNVSVSQNYSSSK